MHRIIKTIGTYQRLRKIPLKVFFPYYCKSPYSALKFYDCVLRSLSKGIRLKADLSGVRWNDVGRDRNSGEGVVKWEASESDCWGSAVTRASSVLFLSCLLCWTTFSSSSLTLHLRLLRLDSPRCISHEAQLFFPAGAASSNLRLVPSPGKLIWTMCDQAGLLSLFPIKF